ncbi:MAG: hypothetical protein V2I36_12930 [Desulfopila sp.]|jgi:hypothetical protein|nr:hypothetical protein [Desulfopila sp.]
MFEEGVWNLVAKYPASLGEGETQQATAQVTFKVIKPLLGAPPVPPNKPLAIKPPLASQKMATAPLAQQNLKPQTTNLPVTAQHGALKTAPSIIGPADNQRFNKTGTIPINAKVSAADVSLIWEIEYQAFGATSFLRQKPSLAGGPATGAGMVKTARLTFSAPGTYRFRVKEDDAKALWSGWRTGIVGSPPPVAPAAKTMHLRKAEPVTDAVKSLPQEQPTKPLPQTREKKIQPFIMKPPTAPITAPRQ